MGCWFHLNQKMKLFNIISLWKVISNMQLNMKWLSLFQMIRILKSQTISAVTVKIRSQLFFVPLKNYTFVKIVALIIIKLNSCKPINSSKLIKLTLSHNVKAMNFNMNTTVWSVKSIFANIVFKRVCIIKTLNIPSKIYLTFMKKP